jgi:ligand-binding sensor domain-containing protein
VETDETPPPTADSVYCRLYRFDAYSEWRTALDRTANDTLLLAEWTQLAGRFEDSREGQRGFHRWLAPLYYDLPRGTHAVDLPDSILTLGQGRVLEPDTQVGRWRIFDAADGLLSGTTMDMIQDRHANIWFATWGGGVSRYDGQRWTSWTTADGLPTDDVAAIYEDSRGHVWIGTGGNTRGMRGGGVAQYDGHRWTRYNAADGLPSDHVTTIGEDLQGDLWFGSCSQEGDHGVSRFDGEFFHVVTTSDGLLSDCVWSIDRDPTDRLCLASTAGFSCLEDNEWVQYPFPRASGAVPDTTAEGILWPHSDGRIGQLAVARSEDGLLWLHEGGWTGGEHHILWSFDGGRYSAHQSPVTEYLSTPQLMVDRDGSLWLGGLGNGAYAPGDAGWSHIGLEQGLPSLRVRALLEDDEGYIWIATSTGVARWERSLTTYRLGSTVFSPEPVFDRSGHLWFAVKDSDIVRFDGDEFRVFGADDGLTGLPIGVDASGRLWLEQPWHTPSMAVDGGSVLQYGAWKTGSFSGETPGGRWYVFWDPWVFHERQGRVRIYSKADGLPRSSFLRGRAVGRDGSFWAGTASDGACRFDGETITCYTPADGLAHQSVWSIYLDRDDNLWFGTDGGGVSRYDGEGFTNYGPTDGLSGTWITSILQDRYGHMWFASAGGGVSRFDGEIFQTLTREDGLSDHSIYGFAEGADGDIWIASETRLTRFRRPEPVPPPVFIDAVVAAGRHTGVRDLSISSSVGLVTFEFHAVSHKTRPGAMVYRYRLTGHHENWRTTSDNRVEYEGLTAGNYTFEVVAIDRDLVRSKQPATVTLEIVHQPLSSSVQIARVELQELFVSYHRTYSQRPVGSVVVINTDPNPVAATLHFFLPGMMGRPYEQEVNLGPNSEVEIPVYASLRPESLAIEGALPVSAEVSLSFAAGEQRISVQETHDLLIHGRGALRWDHVGRAAAFITPTSPAVTGFVRPLLVGFEDRFEQLGRPGRNLLQAMALFAGIRAHGVRYVVDANTPYARVRGQTGAVDHVQSAFEVLQRQSGDCDDLTALYCSLLESAGIATALVDYPGHVFLLFDTGVARWEAYKLPVDPRLCVVRDDGLWIPLEITRLDGSFHEAWRAGADELAKLSTVDQRRRIVDTASAWESFPPSALPGDEVIAPPAATVISGAVDAQQVRLTDMIDEQIRRVYLDAMRNGGADNALRTRLLRVYVALARYDDAISTALDFLIDDRGDKAATHNHLGIAYFLKGETKQAAYQFKQAVDANPEDEGMRRNLGQALWTLGRTAAVVPDELLAVATAAPLKGDTPRLDETSFYWVESLLVK